jgi:hypothetical protein
MSGCATFRSAKRGASRLQQISTVAGVVPSRKDNVDIIREMALAAARARAGGEAVNAELGEDFANEQLKVRVRIGKRSTVFAVYNGDVERVQGDRAVVRKLERLIQDALSEIPL